MSKGYKASCLARGLFPESKEDKTRTALEHAVSNKLAHTGADSNIQSLEQKFGILLHEIQPGGNDHVTTCLTHNCCPF